jgi:hypothetical protein
LFASKKPIGDGFAADVWGHVFFFVVVILLCIPWDEIYKKGSKPYDNGTLLLHRTRPALSLILLILCTIMLVDSTYNPFIYFRF